ncbi:hypothetical protein B0H10DRAFT_313222 [Mycena sp. CBHHK59/15]|nr:hypothetical protein B0H10DRAFT_313222 [Mycena sp. CBHHK59/15]
MFVSPLSSSILAPGLPDIGIRYGIDNETIRAMVLSIFLLSYAIGPLFLAPLSVFQYFVRLLSKISSIDLENGFFTSETFSPFFSILDVLLLLLLGLFSGFDF